ncbi:acyl-CoA-binding protein, partial [Saccharata proteae CBS 121410]
SPSNDEMLQMYALAKVAKQEDISKASKPGMFDLAGKAKQSAWQKEVDAGTSPEEAEKKYVELVNQLKEKYG